MEIHIARSNEEAGRRAALFGRDLVAEALGRNGRAAIVVATGSSQFALYDELVRASGLDWGRVTLFHLDEYIGLPEEHPASFRRYLRERLVARLPAPAAAFHAIDGEADPAAECARLEALIGDVPIDVAFVGIGENGHLAFNDPPADFACARPFIVVDLDEACRKQQLGEGWFARLEDVPRRAISMSILQIMKARAIVCTVPEARKAAAVKRAVEGPVTPDLPASILQRHDACRLFLDRDAAALLSQKGGER